jgi:single-stranded-DNA-specific exonuclease
MREEKEKTIYKMNHKWNYQPPSQEQTEAAKALAKETGINPVLCKLLLERGITSAAEAKRFFRPQLSELHDPDEGYEHCRRTPKPSYGKERTHIGLWRL